MCLLKEKKHLFLNSYVHKVEFYTHFDNLNVLIVFGSRTGNSSYLVFKF